MTSMRPRSRQRGFSLIEVLVAVLVLAVGMLGIAAMQAVALRNSQSAYERSQGVMMTYSILDAMRANKPDALIARYNLAMSCVAPDPDTVARTDLNRWISSMKAVLGPSACGRVTCDANGVCAISVQWDDSRGSQVRANPESYSVTTRTRL